MKIIYENNEVKNACQNEYTDLTTENILKYFNLILGNKVRVYDYACSENHTKTMKVENLRNHSIRNVTIKYDDRKHIPGFRPFGISHLVTIAEEVPNSKIVFGITCEVGRHVMRELCNNYYHQESGLMIEEGFCKPFNPNKKMYTLKMNNKVCELVLTNVEKDIIYQLLEIPSLDLKTIYESLRTLNEQYVQDISLDFSNNQTEETEKLHIYNNQLCRYEKTYQKDGDLITINYKDGKIFVTTKQELSDEAPIKTKEIDVTDDIQKVKTLLSHNNQTSCVRKMSQEEETHWLNAVKQRATELTMPEGIQKMADAINKPKKNKSKLLSLKKK